jgi:hypothetical protein
MLPLVRLLRSTPPTGPLPQGEGEKSAPRLALAVRDSPVAPAPPRPPPAAVPHQSGGRSRRMRLSNTLVLVLIKIACRRQGPPRQVRMPCLDVFTEAARRLRHDLEAADDRTHRTSVLPECLPVHSRDELSCQLQVLGDVSKRADRSRRHRQHRFRLAGKPTASAHPGSPNPPASGTGQRYTA